LADNDLLPLLRDRLLGIYSPLLADTTATLLFTAGGMANWTVEIDRGRAEAHRGGPPNPTTTVRASLPVLNDVVAGRRGGVEAFLSGDLTVRGNLALALQLDGLFPGDASDPTRTYTRSTFAGGIETFYLEAGPVDAPPVVLVHGLGATNASMLPLVAALSRDFHVFAPDLPGHGGTQAKNDQHAAAFLGSWLLAFIRETCDRPPVLVGNSLGGRTSLEAALLSADDVRGLVLLCPAVAFRKLRQFVPVVRLVRNELATCRCASRAAWSPAVCAVSSPIRPAFPMPGTKPLSTSSSASWAFAPIDRRSSPRCATSISTSRSARAASGSDCPLWRRRRCSCGVIATSSSRRGSPDSCPRRCRVPNAS
jgi:pimeloyl-ACP methyl ester carboxylesterase